MFIGLLNTEPGRVDDTLKVWQEAERGETVIWTSVFSMIEVYKAKCNGMNQLLAPSKEQGINDLFNQPWVERVIVDTPLAALSRKLLRSHHPTCRKPTDGLHLAAAAMWNVDELHTWDESDLLRLDGIVAREDGVKLRICKPYELKPSPEADSAQTGLFEYQADT